MIKTMIKRFLNDQSGSTAVEYGMVITLFSLVMLIWWNSSSDGIDFQFGEVSSVLDEQAVDGNDVAAESS